MRPRRFRNWKVMVDNDEDELMPMRMALTRLDGSPTTMKHVRKKIAMILNDLVDSVGHPEGHVLKLTLHPGWGRKFFRDHEKLEDHIDPNDQENWQMKANTTREYGIYRDDPNDIADAFDARTLHYAERRANYGYSPSTEENMPPPTRSRRPRGFRPNRVPRQEQERWEDEINRRREESGGILGDLGSGNFVVKFEFE